MSTNPTAPAPIPPKPTGFNAMLAWYSNQLKLHPIRTKALSSAILAGFGDAIAQIITSPPTGFDVTKTVRFSLFGFTVGNLIHFWYMVLDRLAPGVSPISIGKKLVLDAFVWRPSFILIFFYFFVNFDRKVFLAKATTELVPTTINAWKLWIPAQLINFKLVPPEYRVLFGNLVALCYNVFLLVKAKSPSK